MKYILALIAAVNAVGTTTDPATDSGDVTITCTEYGPTGCFTGTGKCAYTAYWAGNTASCPGTCSCDTIPTPTCTDNTSCFTETGRCSGTGTGYWSGNTNSCPGTCECSGGSSSGSSYGFSIGADEIAAYREAAVTLIGTPCTATGPECPVEGEVCYGATITSTDTTHPGYI